MTRRLLRAIISVAPINLVTSIILVTMIILIILIMGPLFGATARAQGAPAPLVGASSDEHLWFAVPAANGSYSLCHLSASAEGPWARTLAPLRERPEALAAWGATVWIVFPPKADRTPAQREVLTLRVERDPVLDAWVADPSDRLDLEPPLPGEGVLAGFAGTGLGAVALITAPAGERSAAAAPSLVRVRGGRWESIPLPAALTRSGRAMLAAGGAEGERLYVLVSQGGVEQLFVLGADGAWEAAAPAPGPVEEPALALVRALGRVAVVSADEHTASVSWLRPGLRLPLATFEPSGDWGVFGLAGALRLLEHSSTHSTVRTIDPLRGTLSARESLEPEPIVAVNRLRIPLIIGAVIIAIALLLVFRPAPTIRLAPGEALLPAGARLAALALDLVPSGILSVLILRCRLVDLLDLPLFGSVLAESLPWALTCAITAVHGAVGEAFFGRSLGKAFIGASVAAAEGGRAGRRRALLRNLVKGAVLLVPALGVVVISNPNRQGLHDLVARTLVVREPEERAEAGAGRR